MTALVRLNWGCGSSPEPGWINSDVKRGPGIEHSGDIRGGLPFDSGSIDYAVSHHALQMIPYPDLVPVLGELHRVLRPDGVIRLGLPDFDKAIAAYQRGDLAHFLVPDADESTLSGKAIVHLLWYGYSVTLFTEEFALDLLGRAGFHDVTACPFRSTKSAFAGIVELDNREHESFFVEGVK